MNHESDRNPSCVTIDQGQDVRLDVYLAARSDHLSRARIQSLIRDGFVKVNDSRSKPSYKLKPGDHVSLRIPEPEPLELKPERIDFDIVYEDRSLIVLNKPPGLVVHPAPGHYTGTLVQGLLLHCQDLSGIGGILRPGIVHRLDKDTSGLMVVAKNDRVHSLLSAQFKAGTVSKQYVALVHGRVGDDEKEISLPISRHPKKRKEMAVAVRGGKHALTRWKKIREFESGFSLLSISIKTGRTHQIRVHLSHVGHPVVGDPVYGYGKGWWKKQRLHQEGILSTINRQMLHAKRLGFFHPIEENYLEFDSILPEDMDHAILALDWLESGAKITRLTDDIKQYMN